MEQTASWDFGASAIPDNTDEWSEWLRWDPTQDAVSPESSTKTSNNSPMQDLGFNSDQFPSLNIDETLAPPLIVGDDANMADFHFDDAAFDFGPPSENKPDELPFLFGAETNNLQPIVDHLRTDRKPSPSFWPQAGQPLQQQQGDLLATLILGSNDHSTATSSGPGSVSSSSHQRSSPASTPQARTSLSSVSPAPEQTEQSEKPPRKKGGRKRKVSSGGEEEEQSPEDGGPPIKKTSHNVIEKRYRNNLNDKIAELRDSVPSLRAMSRPSGDDGSEDLEGLTPAHKLNKATVLAKATEYIKHLEKRNKTQATEMDKLKARLSSIEKSIANAKSMAAHQSGMLTPSIGRSRQGSLASQATRNQYMQQHAQPAYEPQDNAAEPGHNNLVNAQGGGGGGGNALMGKLMVGSLAALMVMEGFHEQEQDSHSTSGRGLFAAPMHLLRRGQFLTHPSHAAYGPATQAALPLLKAFLVIGAFIYILLPLFRFKPQPKPKASIRISLTAAPSLASPVEVRRKAWLTAVQSVWMPRHFLLEVVSVTSKMIKLSLRRLIGSEYYSMISGKTPDDEAARIKAWDIAIDAQLAGGDAEVSYYRLLLTLMASGTLPDSPIRLMQKAVHFRIFFWEVANAGYGNLFMFRDFTAKVGRIYWDSARKQQHALVAGHYDEKRISDDKIEKLPGYLAELIELDCDDVLTDEMIQRAYNLAWNRPSAENTIPNPTMDSVVEDHAIRSPLDAVAAWFANVTIDGALTRSFDTDNDAGTDVRYLIDMANKTAPPASGTQTRAHVAKAVLLDEDREADIIAALDTLPFVPSNDASDMLSNMITHTPVSPDTHTALTLAKIISIASPTNPTPARVHASSALSSFHLTPNSITLLTAVAAFKALSVFSSDAMLFNSGKVGLDDLAGSLRLWIGSRSGKMAGLTRDQKAAVVESCLSVSKRVGGWKIEEEKDSGYGSFEDGEKEARVVKS